MTEQLSERRDLVARLASESVRCASSLTFDLRGEHLRAYQSRADKDREGRILSPKLVKLPAPDGGFFGFVLPAQASAAVATCYILNLTFSAR